MKKCNKKMSVAFMLLIITKVMKVVSMKVSKRFPRIPSGQFYLLVPGGGSGLVTESNLMEEKGIGDFLELLFKSINVSMTMTSLNSYGTCNETTGLYDGGMIEMIQSGKADALIVPQRYDSTPCEPGHFVHSFHGEHSPRIYSTANYTSQSSDRREIVYLLNNFDFEVWTYFVCVFLIAGALITSMALESKVMAKKRFIVYHFFKTLWNFFMLLVDLAPTTISKVTSQTVLWTVITVSAFYAFHCIFFNTLAADLSVPPQVRFIETLNDLLNNSVFNVTPLVAKQLIVLQTLERFRNGTPEKQLYQKIVANPNVSIFEIDPKDLTNPQLYLPQVTRLINNITDGKMAVIEDDSLLTKPFTTTACHVKNNLIQDMMKKLVVSKESFASGPQAYLVSKHTDPMYLKVMNYRSLTASEFGIKEGWHRGFGEKKASEINGGQGVSQTGYQCADRLLRTSPLIGAMASKTGDKKYQPMVMDFFKSLQIISIVIIIFAFYVLIFEKLLFNYESSMGKKNKKNWDKIRKGHKRIRSVEHFKISNPGKLFLKRPMTAY